MTHLQRGRDRECAQTGGAVLPPGATFDDPFEFIMRMDHDRGG